MTHVCNYLILVEILKEFGYIGVFLYNQIINTFSEKEFSRNSENFVYNLIQFYSKNFYLHFYESEKFDNVRQLIDIIANKFDVLADLIKMDRIIKKEHIIVKSLLDLIIHYYTKCELHLRNKILTNDIIPTGLIFYYKLNTADIVALYMMIKNTKNLKGILGNY